MDAFEDFFAEHYGSVLRSLRLVVVDLGRAEDLAQEAFARAWSRWRTVSSMDRPLAWVYVVAINAERRRWRRERTRPASWSQDMTDPDPAGHVLVAVRLREALGALPVRQRTAIVLRYLVDLTVVDVAAAMGCAEGTVKATLHHALHALRVDLEDDDAS